MKDRFTAGFLAGAGAAIPMNIIDLAGYYFLPLHEERLLDWASIFMFGRLPNSIWETVFAQLGQIIFSGLLGIIFAYALLKLTSGNYLIKGAIYGVTASFTIYSISILFNVKGLTQHTFVATVSHFITALVYGLVMTLILSKLLGQEGFLNKQLSQRK